LIAQPSRGAGLSVSGAGMSPDAFISTPLGTKDLCIVLF
jgi:hypothetical protein